MPIYIYKIFNQQKSEYVGGVFYTIPSVAKAYTKYLFYHASFEIHRLLLTKIVDLSENE